MPQAGKPGTIKLINLSVIREMFMLGGLLTCAEISAETGISITTVRATVNEMLERGELESRGTGESSGGRKSERFIINDNCYNGISVCVTDKTIFVSVVDIHSRVLETQSTYISKEQDLCETLTELLTERAGDKTRAVGIGVPGVVTPNGFLRKSGRNLTENVDFLPALKQCLAKSAAPGKNLRPLSFVVENDLGASALGFAGETKNGSAAAFINLESGCKEISAGFVDGSRILHGMGNFSGELGFIPYDDARDFRDALYGCENENERTEILAKLTAMVCCVINPHRVMLCGSDFKINRAGVANYLAKRLPSKMLPEIFLGSDFKQYFIKGMAAITARSIFI